MLSTAFVAVLAAFLVQGSYADDKTAKYAGGDSHQLVKREIEMKDSGEGGKRTYTVTGDGFSGWAHEDQIKSSIQANGFWRTMVGYISNPFWNTISVVSQWITLPFNILRTSAYRIFKS